MKTVTLWILGVRRHDQILMCFALYYVSGGCLYAGVSHPKGDHVGKVCQYSLLVPSPWLTLTQGWCLL